MDCALEIRSILECHSGARVSLYMSYLSGDLVDATLYLHVHGLDYTFGELKLTGYDLRSFVNDLDAVYRAQKGTARLCSFDEEIVVSFAMRQSHGSLQARVGARLRRMVHADDGEDGALELLVECGGLMLDQSYLPSLVSRLSEFIRLSYVRTDPPWQWCDGK